MYNIYKYNSVYCVIGSRFTIMEKLSDDELDIHSKKSITPKKKRSIRNELSKPEKKSCSSTIISV